MQPPAPLAGPLGWFAEQTRARLALDSLEGSKRYQAFVADSRRTLQYSSDVRRIQNQQGMKYMYPLARDGYIAGVMTVHAPRHNSGTETHYAYIYWPRHSSGLSGQASKIARPEYVCLAPTYISQDGEYRNNFIQYEDFERGFDDTGRILSSAETALLHLVAKGDLTMRTEYYPDISGPQGKAIREGTKALRLQIRVLTAVYAEGWARFTAGTQSQHLSPVFVSIFQYLYAVSPRAYAAWTQAEAMAKFCWFSVGMADNPRALQCGQKLAPLSVQESARPGDINFASWREHWVSKAASALVVNGVGPMFPLAGGWTFLTGTHAEMFETPAMRARHDDSVLADEAVATLRRLRKSLLARQGGRRLDQLDTHLYGALLHAQDNVQLSGLTLLALSEYVGDTAQSTADHIRAGNKVIPVFADSARYLFDLCYGAHALHTRVGAVHADLHLNNVTFNPIYSKPDANWAIAYVAGPGGEADTYVFPHTGWFATIIDFSRAILGPAARASLVAEHGEAYTSGFYRDQARRTMQVLHHYLPNTVDTSREIILSAIYANPDHTFRILTAVDFLAIGRNIGHLYRVGRAGPDSERYDPEGVKLADLIEEVALHHLDTYLTELVRAMVVEGAVSPDGSPADPTSDPTADPTATDRVAVDNIPYAGDTIIRQVFSQYSYTAQADELQKKGRDVVDIYNIMAPLKYTDANRVEPPWLNLDTIEAALGPKVRMQASRHRGDGPYKLSRGKSAHVACILDRLRRGKAADTIGAATVSWGGESSWVGGNDKALWASGGNKTYGDKFCGFETFAEGEDEPEPPPVHWGGSSDEDVDDVGSCDGGDEASWEGGGDEASWEGGNEASWGGGSLMRDEPAWSSIRPWGAVAPDPGCAWAGR